MIGNDVVSAKIWAGRSSTILRRYADKILTPNEMREWIARPTAQHLFQFWACKEAAFKSCSRQMRLSGFSPKEFEVLLSHIPEVRHLPSQRKLSGRMVETKTHTSVTLHEGRCPTIIEVKYSGSSEDSLNALTKVMSYFTGNEGQVIKDGGIPNWVTKSNSYPMSISHCGSTTIWVVAES